MVDGIDTIHYGRRSDVIVPGFHLRKTRHELRSTTVFDPISARIAEDLGFEVAMLAGSVASLAVLGAPDLVVLTLTELAEQAHRICRASQIPLIVDADHGFGNALNVRRTIEELETAGVSGITIEDTDLPAPYGTKKKGLVSVEEAVGKMEAALGARQDPGLSIFGRTTAFSSVTLDEAVSRVKTYAATGVDGIFLVGITDWQQLEAVRYCTGLPLLLGSANEQMKDPVRLAEMGVSIALEGHAPFKAAVDAVYRTLKQLRTAARPETVAAESPDENIMDRVSRRDSYRDWAKKTLGTA
jgi:carboxyvinyl-carboxyphosphonate phosphorylmutase